MQLIGFCIVTRYDEIEKVEKHSFRKKTYLKKWRLFLFLSFFF